MSDQNFLAHFIEEPLYVIKEDATPTPDTSTTEPMEKKEEPKPQEATLSLEVGVVDAPTTVEEPAAPVYVKPLPTAGNNLKHCIVLVDSSEELLEEPLKDLLYKIIGAVKRNPEDILLANCRDAGKDQIEALLANNNHKHLLAFGTDVLTELNGIQPYAIHKPKYVAMLKADPLSEIASDVDKKKALWKALQEMFL
ncbi:hypothetical protein BFP97_03975 [Roseivirga sp. 4D4]|uniref:hypothetical protein n=1 Tax=Roseivirga sp. 4D4 TaxID=1889784 RepID=UPI000852F697|nr:hypothetical protein [Roseivirga sp. 4D4]OEK00716.1 hypothetical protein BFP97_03975 [Roseivirga sp. 4D4]